MDWTPISDELPIKEDPYLYPDGPTTTFAVFFPSAALEWWRTVEERLGLDARVTAWMPKPELYEQPMKEETTCVKRLMLIG